MPVTLYLTGIGSTDTRYVDARQRIPAGTRDEAGRQRRPVALRHHEIRIGDGQMRLQRRELDCGASA